MITFEYPVVGPTASVTLRNPDMGDSNSHILKSQFGISANSTIYNKITVTANRTHLITVILLEDDIDNLNTFLLVSAGQEIKYTDKDAVAWNGYLQTVLFKFDKLVNKQKVTLQFIGSEE